jgi:hypothetical protein
VNPTATIPADGVVKRFLRDIGFSKASTGQP